MHFLLILIFEHNQQTVAKADMGFTNTKEYHSTALP
jgi:hypothetical protein